MTSRMTLTLFAGLLSAAVICLPVLAQDALEEGLLGGPQPYALEDTLPLPGDAARGRADREATPSEPGLRPPAPQGCPFRQQKLDLIV